VPEFYDVVHGQRACRAFRDDAVPDEVVARLLAAATHAPSAENRQPWLWVVVRHPDRRAAIGDLMRRAWEAGGRAWSEGRLPDSLLAEVDRGATGGLASAPVMVVVAGDTERSHPNALAASIFPAVQNLLLAAAAEGLGSVLTTLALRHADELSALLGLPAHLVPMAVVPLGHPARPAGTPRRRPLSEVARREDYATPW
jgi:nitroreductase